MITPSAVLRKLLALVRHADRVVAGWIGGRAKSPRAPSRCSADRPVDRPADGPVESPADRERLLDAIRRLPKQHAIPLRLTLEGLSMSEVAKGLSLPSEHAVRKRIQLAVRVALWRYRRGAGQERMNSRGETLWQAMASDVVPSIDPPRQPPSFGRSRADLRIAIGRLPERLARPLLLIVEEGLSLQQVADRLGKSAAAVRKRIERAVGALWIALERDRGGGGRGPAWGGT